MRNRLVIVSLLFFVILSMLPTGNVGKAQTQTPGPGQTTTPTTSTPIATATPEPSPGSGPTSTPTPSSGDRFFSQTGYNVPAVFVTYWDAHGGLPVFGFPISAAHVEHSQTDGKDYLVQYFERNRFEYHPENQPPNDVLLGLLGVELTQGRTFANAVPFADSSARVYFSETRHSLGEPFLSYWKNNGGLAVYGYPISEPMDEFNAEVGMTFTVQYFQRNRFEFHPENKPPYDVLLGLLGRDLLDLQDAINAWGPAIVGAPPRTEAIWLPVKPAAGGKFLKGPTVGDGMIVQAYYQDRERILNLVNDLSYTWIKQQIQWKDTENPKGTYFFDELDNVVNTAQAHNVKVIVTVAKAPDWATGGGNGFPTNPQDLGDFMQALAAHFKGRVAAYEIWNEQNLSGESGDVNPARYVELLKAAYRGVKAADPGAIVVSGALSPSGVNDPQGKRAPGAMGVMPDTIYLEQMFQYHDGEVRRYYDVLGTHPYGFNNPPDTNWPDNPNWNLNFPLASDGKPDWYNRHDSFYFRRIEEQRSIMEKYGDGQKQMWVTEYGWCSDVRPDGYGECKYVTPDQQGQYIVGAIQRAKQYYPWMGPMFVWNLNFSTFQDWFTGPSHFSIINPDWTGRPAYFIIKNRPR